MQLALAAETGEKERRKKPPPVSAALKPYLRQFDKELQGVCDKASRQFGVACEKVEQRINRCEEAMHNLIRKTRAKSENELKFAETLVNKELRSKIVTAQWSNYFLSATDEETIDPISFGITRYSLNMCLCWRDVPPEYLMQCNVHKHLVYYAGFDTELVAGPATMALVHISLHPEMKYPIVTAGVLPGLLRRIVLSNSRPVLTQVCKLLASLSLQGSNKTAVASSGCLHGALDLVMQVNKKFKTIDVDIQYAALTAVVNTTSQCDANRKYVVDLNGIRPLLEAIQTSSNNAIILEAVKALANTAFQSKFTAGCILTAGGDLTLVEVLESSDILRQPLISHAALSCLANLCNYDATQSHIGYTKGCVEAAIRICDLAKEPYVVAQAATLLNAIMWNNTSNKIRIASFRNIGIILIKRLIHHCKFTDEDNLHCVERICIATSTFLLFPSNYELLVPCKGMDEVSNLIKKHNNPRIMAGLAQIVCTIVPSPDDLLRYHLEEYICEADRLQVLPLLKKCRLNGFGHLPEIPDWLERSIKYMSLADEGLALEAPWTKKEYVDMKFSFQEFVTEVHPDSDVMNDLDLRGLIFSLY